MSGPDAKPNCARVLHTELWLARALNALLAIVVLHSLFVLIVWVDQPLLGPHSFRQTQTALSAYWFGQGGPFFAYETPALGAPWSIPFEFPLFQGLVALVGQSGIPLDIAGRVTSFAFFLGSLLPLRLLFRHLRLDGPSFAMTAILLLSCPLLLFWGRAFLIESCAVFFGLLWLALLACYVDRPTSIVAAATLIAGCLAVLVKSTTFVPFLLLGGSLVAVRFIQAGRPRKRGPVFFATALTLLPLLVGYAWVVFTDNVKTHNDIAQQLTSNALVGWNFGTLDQKLGPALWVDTVWTRVLPETLGLAFFTGLVVVAAGFGSRRHLFASALCVAAFIVPFVLFTNLHVVHDYYQSANAGFLVAAVGISLAGLSLGALRRLAFIALLMIVAGQFGFFYLHYRPLMRMDSSENRLYRIAAMARERTNPGESLIVIGDDWSSVVPYYSQRKSLVLPPWAGSAVIDRLIDDPQSLLGDSPLGAIVFCKDRLGDYKDRASGISRFVSARTVLASVDGCALLSSRSQ